MPSEAQLGIAHSQHEESRIRATLTLELPTRMRQGLAGWASIACWHGPPDTRLRLRLLLELLLSRSLKQPDTLENKQNGMEG